MTPEQRVLLAALPCESKLEIAAYREYLRRLVKSITNENATDLKVDSNPAWAQLNEVPSILMQKAKELNFSVSITQWRGLGTLQRFALLKLSSASHESKNFPKALREFNLV